MDDLHSCLSFDFDFDCDFKIYCNYNCEFNRPSKQKNVRQVSLFLINFCNLMRVGQILFSTPTNCRKLINLTNNTKKNIKGKLKLWTKVLNVCRLWTCIVSPFCVDKWINSIYIFVMIFVWCVFVYDENMWLTLQRYHKSYLLKMYQVSTNNVII